MSKSIPTKFRIFGHPPHTFLIHFPFALLVTAVLWDGVGLLHPAEPLWWQLSYWTMALGILSGLIAAVTGFIDLLSIPGKDPAMQTGIWHMMLMLTAVCLYAGSILVRGGFSPPSTAPSAMAMTLSAIGCLVLMMGGWFGGELVFRHGVGQGTDSFLS